MTPIILLSTAEFGELLGMTAQFVRGEMRDGRLRADFEIDRPGKGKIYKFTPTTFVRYCQQYCPRALELPHILRQLGLARRRDDPKEVMKTPYKATS
ncbi:MAG: hypothetical protein Q8T13_05000 [Acidobacteriota bacterium]|nr:hypothetical protein [Acidobacteriota bacterium]